MKITKIKIENFKSIKEIEFILKKYGNSHTVMLVGVNESGKSNILEAMSYLSTPNGEFDFNAIHNQKDETSDSIDIWFSLEFEQKQTYVDAVVEVTENGDLLDFELENIIKNVYLQKGESTFSEYFSFDIKKLAKKIFIKKTQKSLANTKGQIVTTDVFILSKTNDAEKSYVELTPEIFKKYFSSKIAEVISKHEPYVSLWRPSEKYLVSEVDLNSFKANINSNIPLKHIFYIAGFNCTDSIKSEINKISNTSLRRKLAGTLSERATIYIKKIWKHDILIDIEITENGSCIVSIRDGGKANEHNYHEMSVRSEGFKQFMSLILSLSIETRTSESKNNLILIDEPEAHLHPSGIRDLRNELLAIGENNYLFVSTHSPFLVDRKDKARNVIIRKNKSALTEKKELDQYTSIVDDEVLREAFGIEVYKDLLNPHSILVEGASDKEILKKAFTIKGVDNYSVTNGHGSNIDTLASKLNDTDISLLVILDDDENGKKFKENIIKIGGSYSTDNVVTLRDLVGGLIHGATIEDVLGVNFMENKVREIYNKTFTNEECGISLNTASPFMIQVRKYLYQNKKTNIVINRFLVELKTKVSDDFEPAKSSFAANFPLLDSLVDAIQTKLN
ncbi:Predicted ATP-dependent endonuclease of the OLD family, contains P-loop ATPase and TOPRIM domains [Nitrosomonas ureae]|uniref:Predicted ATP-dependent endonuclease of the OLD family, contains P-loop ATPase and TOPRIM domains n=1 Tax=Nitrosomonas ureae TaxID=44577 RepID=A0A285C1B9_9PROT|nr:AAA family ATPase [Nitrosomonas ureae]SNX61260.1 Predicted ATP-dependent endonuclease of the OLD family, contains P-loop ATPase and TOPRIM domains [Nitrosomonas ureae]